jgi:hypothetical protein
MNKLNFLFLLLILTCTAKAQYKEILFIDSLNKLPVQDVYVQTNINNKISIIGFSNINGIFKINIKEDTLKLITSHISYYKKEILIKSLKSFGTDTIYLTPKSSNLSNVTVENFKTNKSKLIGFYKNGEKQNLYAPTYQSIFGTILLIDLKIKKYKIQTLYCDFKKLNLVEHRKSDCKVGVIFHFLKVSEFVPTLEDAIEPIVIDYNNLKQNFKLEIPNSGIIDNSTGAIFIGIELQEIKCNEQSFNFKSYYLVNLASTKNMNWIYNFKQNRWKQYDDSLFSGKLGISIKITYYE